jgi:hypothetical protein
LCCGRIQILEEVEIIMKIVADDKSRVVWDDRTREDI